MEADSLADLDWSVVTAEPDVQLAGVARVLNALSGMADAVALASRSSSASDDVRSHLSAASLPAESWTGPVGSAHYAAVGALLTISRQPGAMLVTLRTGSIEGRIRDLVDRVRRIGRLLEASTALVPAKRDPQRFWDQGVEILREAAGGTPPTTATNALAVSGRELMLAYEQINASAAGVPAQAGL